MNGNIRFRCLVLQVIDGDTIEVLHGLNKERVRLIGIDAPEKGHYFYSNATNFLGGILAIRHYVNLVFDGDLKDKYGRLRAHVILPINGRIIFVNHLMIRQGFAKVRTVHSHRFERLFCMAEKEAQKEKKGMWKNSLWNSIRNSVERGD